MWERSKSSDGPWEKVKAVPTGVRARWFDWQRRFDTDSKGKQIPRPYPPFVAGSRYYYRYVELTETKE